MKTMGARSLQRAYELRRGPIARRAGSSRSAKTAPARRPSLEARRILAAVSLRSRSSLAHCSSLSTRCEEHSQTGLDGTVSVSALSAWESFFWETVLVPLSSPSEVSSRWTLARLMPSLEVFSRLRSRDFRFPTENNLFGGQASTAS